MALTQPRTDKDILIDRMLLLHSVKNAEKIGWIGSTKIQKIVFFSEYLMNNRNIRGHNLLFRRLHFGPYSDDLKKDIVELSSIDYLSVDDKGSLVLGDTGNDIIDDIIELLEDNKQVSDAIMESIYKIAPLDTEETLKFIYALPYKSKHGNTVGDVPDGGTICRPIDEFNTFNIDRDWLETLDLLFNFSSVENLIKILDKSPRTPSAPFMVEYDAI